MPEPFSGAQTNKASLHPKKPCLTQTRPPARGACLRAPPPHADAHRCSYTRVHTHCLKQSLVLCFEPLSIRTEAFVCDPPNLQTFVNPYCVPPASRLPGGHQIAQLFHCLLQQLFCYNSCGNAPLSGHPKKDQGFLRSWTTALLSPLAHLDS